MDFQEGVTVPLALNDVGGETKAISDRRLASFQNTDMNVGVTCIHEVHGYLDGDDIADKKCASLLVLRFELGSRATGRRFKVFKPLLTFHSKPKSERSDEEPFVTDAIEPGLYAVHICEFTSEIEKEHQFKAAVNVKPPEPIPVEGGLEWSRHTKEGWTEIYRYTVQASRSQDEPDPYGEYNQLGWKAEQGKLIKTGIDIMQVAFLIRRTEGYDLQIKFNLDADVDFKYKFRKGFKRSLGLPSSEITVGMTLYETNPTTGAKTLRQTQVPAGVDRNYLGKLEKEGRDVFRRLAWVHNMEQLDPIVVYGKAQTGPNTQEREQAPGTAAEDDEDLLDEDDEEYESADSWATADSQL